ncbi:rod shape-determining protein RodA [Flavobacteriaceae bacterium]|uniref:rod shape-determining protein RodA n=1 Tax=Candidatus Arcticimaribacter forsetii TaxID=2820661 RepID=UPI0020771EEB|nr:rod shape-determining protein RodA [Candidatus Arcticimaribacter forsetii]MDA8698947.1 rod shape-determining protein RodA [Flavobacteriaceae bacterium]MDB2328949.1 rod shape-determining protein RodA [Flavobacteriaceae bacterium]MDB2345248.1 rod shape-determining protein RodA [Flavobacteriaceae bacterium]MDB4620504.1 rod shape-determining protein RodA [Flavobacteriaceae bacterium]MDB4642851.1 rod shape-determining protein RodA [Flavobacteriaceae bacterium]
MNKIIYRLDWVTILLYVALVIFGISNIYSTNYNENSNLINLKTPVGKQVAFAVASFIVAIVMLTIKAKVFERFASVFYLLTLILLIGLFAFGSNISGATSWYSFGGVGLQPSEFAKVTTSLAVAKLLSEIQIDIRKIKSLVQVALIIVLPMILIVLQPDPGTALVFSAFFFVLFREGLNSFFLITAFSLVFFFILSLLAPIPFVFASIITLSISLYFFSRKFNKKTSLLPYLGVIIFSCSYVYSVDYIFNNVFEQRHRDRFNIILGKEVDSQGIGYNINQSKIAIGSGGWEGKGFLQGTQTKGNFVPEQHTDYIFSTIGEEWGFYGSTAVVFVFCFLIIRIVYRAENLKNNFARIYGHGVAAILFLHFFINIGMSLGLVPTIGIPLPFISYGGSSLLGFTCLLFIFLNLDANRLSD